MDELGLFTLALGLTRPWRVSDLRFSKEAGRLDLRIDFVKGATFPCPACDWAYGFKHVNYLRIIIYLVAGRLTFSYPQQMEENQSG